jgi:Fe-S-cluster containining protein
MNSVQTPEALNALVAMHRMYTMFDGATNLLSKHLGVSLCEMCGRCCEQNTPLAYGLEAAYSVSRLIGRGKSDEMQWRIEGWLLDRQKECPTYEPLLLDKLTFGLDNKIRDEVLALSRTPCPFMENKMCLIHEERGLTCRAYGVTHHIEGCKRKLGKGESVTRRTILSGDAVAALKHSLGDALDYCTKETWRSSGFLPTLIYSLLWPNKFQEMVSKGQIATAKLVMTQPSMAVIWEEQVEALTEKDMVFKK